MKSSNKTIHDELVTTLWWFPRQLAQRLLAAKYGQLAPNYLDNLPQSKDNSPQMK